MYKALCLRKLTALLYGEKPEIVEMLIRRGEGHYINYGLGTQWSNNIQTSGLWAMC